MSNLPSKYRLKQCHKSGRYAASCGAESKDNPHPAGTMEGIAWHQGFYEYRREIINAKYGKGILTQKE